MITNDSGTAATSAGRRLAQSAIWRAPLLLMAALLLVQLGGENLAAVLRYDRAAIDQGQLWRLLSGHFAHLGWYHWMLNELGLVLLVLLCGERLSLAVLLHRVLLIGLCVGLGLYVFVPGLSRYVGMSGIIHGLFVLGLVAPAVRRDWIAAGCLALLIGKLVYETVAGVPLSDEVAIGGRVITAAHSLGVLAAVFYALLFRSWKAGESRPDGRQPDKQTMGDRRA